MHARSLFSLFAVASAAIAQDAPVVENNPIGAQYEAQIHGKAPYQVAGAVKIASGAAGTGVTVEIALANLPTEGGPFMYHIHEKPVPEDGNCTGTGAHLDPYKRGETPACDANNKKTCQVGDLSGKHGNMTTTSFSAVYNDDFLATLSSDVSYFGDKSIVVHLSNKTRIACANFKLLSPDAVTTTASSIGTSYGTALPSVPASHGGHNATTSASPTGASSTGSPIQPTTSPTANPTSTPAPPGTGAAGKVAVSGVALVAFLVAMML